MFSGLKFQYTVGPTSRFNIWANAIGPELANERFGAIIEVTNGVPIAVERAMYNSSAGVLFAGDLEADGEETTLQNRGGSIQSGAKRFDAAQDVAPVQRVEHIELPLQLDLSNGELLREAEIELIPPIEVLRARFE